MKKAEAILYPNEIYCKALLSYSTLIVTIVMKLNRTWILYFLDLTKIFKKKNLVKTGNTTFSARQKN